MTPMSSQEIKRTLKALKQNNWSRVGAARDLKMRPNAICGRVATLKAQGHRIPDSAPVTKQSKGARPVDSSASEIKELRTKLAAAEKALGMARAKPLKISSTRESMTKAELVFVYRPDVHGVYQDPEAVSAYLEALRIIKPDVVVGLGDLIDAGSFLAAHHTLGYVSEAAYSVEDDVSAARAFLDAEQEASGGCRHIEIEGNHDHRIEQWCVTTAQKNGGGNIKEVAKFLMSKFSPAELFAYKKRGFEYIERGTVHEPGLPTGTWKYGPCLVTHGNFTGADSVHRALNAYGMSVIFGHVHRILGVVKSNTAQGVIGAWSPGCLSKIVSLWNHSRPVDWVHGFGVQTWSKEKRFQYDNIVINKGKALLFTGAKR